MLGAHGARSWRRGAPLQLLRPQAQPSDRAAPTFPRPHLAPSGANLSLQALKQEHVMVPQMVLINLPLGGHLCLGPELGTPTESLPYLLCSLEEDWAGESPFLLKDTGRGRQRRGMGQQGKTGLGAPTEAELAVDSVRETVRSPQPRPTRAQCTEGRGRPQRAAVLEGD